ncbi:dCTP deaminase [Streptomyces erythrochromogenes]|uniref:dCTP deaminase n=1 Tax=Streptomyces erythrochromogenes TaxID=285574 RepID=UPI00382E6C72
MLSAESIKHLTETGGVTWPGELRGDGLLLTLGNVIQPLHEPRYGIVDLADQASIDALYGVQIDNWTTYNLRPQQMVIVPVAQPLTLGPNVFGVIGGLSHLARVGLAVHITSPYVLPGWSGHLALELVNHGPATLRLRVEMPVARLLLLPRGGGPVPSAHPFYGDPTHLKSRYADEFFAGPSER